MDADEPGTSPQLGFGCAALSLAHSPAHHDALLGAGWDAGVRWFDVARSYSYGAAEQVLGRFLRGRRDEATVVTKFGIAPPRGVGGSALLRRVARQAVTVAPGLKRRLTARADRGTSAGDFSVAGAQASLEASLRALDTDRVDALLLHEAAPGALGDDLHAWLQAQVERGTVLRWGTATTGGDATAAVLRAHPWAGPLVQVADPGTTPLPAVLHDPTRLLVTHSVLGAQLPALRARLAQQPALAAQVAAATGVDLADPASLGPLLLSAAAARNPHGVVLFASRDLARCAASARALQTVPPEAARAALAALGGSEDLGRLA